MKSGMKRLLFFAVILISFDVDASDFGDPHPFQSQCFYRIEALSPEAGQIEVMTPAPVPEYHYFVPGDPQMRTETHALLLLDKRNPLTETLLAGTNYLFLKSGEMATISADGFLNYKGKVSITPEIAGGVYFIAAGSREVYVIDSFGFFVSGGYKAGEVKILGGNYFIDQTGLLTTLKSMGEAAGSGIGIVTEKRGWTFRDVLKAGGNYFLRANGTLVTVSSVTGNFQEGIVPVSLPSFIGGNYYWGADRVLYTVDYQGIVRGHPELDMSSQPKTLGYSFTTFEDGTMVAIDSDGNPHRTVVRVSTTGVRAKVIRSFDDNLDRNSLFSPRILK